MNNHNDALTEDIDKFGLKNTIFLKKEVVVKKKVSKNQGKGDDMTNSLTPIVSSTKVQKPQTQSSKYVNSTKKYDIDSLSGSDDDQDDDQDDNENDESYMVLSLQDIIKSIPTTATKTPSHDLQQTHTEWRWRFFDLRGRKLIEISKMTPGSKRIYMDNRSKWTEYTLKKEWDKFVVDTRYCYVEK